MKRSTNARCARGVLAALLCLGVLGGCAQSHESLSTAGDSGLSPEEEAISQAKDVKDLKSPLVLDSDHTETLAFRLGEAHPSAGYSYHFVGRNDDFAAMAEVVHKPNSKDTKADGDKGTSYLLLRVITEGEEDIALTRCYKDTPDTQGNCRKGEEAGGKGEQGVVKFHVKVK